MKRTLGCAAAVLLSFALQGCSHFGESKEGGGWTALFDGTSLDHFNQVGDANWKLADGIVSADLGTGFLVTKESYGDFEIRVEFYAEPDTNSGVFLRCGDAVKLDSNVCYEVNIWDMRPVQKYGTGAIVDTAAVDPMPKAGGHWNTYDITARGDHLVVVLNGTKTADVHNAKHARGPIGLQRFPGVDKTGKHVIRFRKVEIRRLEG